jgi:hypothetical protein
MFCMVTYSTIYPKTHASSLHVIWLPDVLLVGKVKKPWDIEVANDYLSYFHDMFGTKYEK